MISLPLLVIALSSANPSPMEVVKSGHESVQHALQSRGAGSDELRARADQLIDFAELARRSLGNEWGKLTAPQQTELTGTMKALLRASYLDRLLTGDGAGSDSQ